MQFGSDVPNLYFSGIAGDRNLNDHNSAAAGLFRKRTCTGLAKDFCILRQSVDILSIKDSKRRFQEVLGQYHSRRL